MGTIIATIVLGGLVASIIAVFATREKRYFLIYVAVGCLAAAAHVIYPLFLGAYEASFRPLRVAIIVCVAVGASVLFSSGKSNR